MCVCVCVCACACVCVCVGACACTRVWLPLFNALFYSSPSNLAQVRSGSLVKIVWYSISIQFQFSIVHFWIFYSVMHAEIQMKMVPKCIRRIMLYQDISWNPWLNIHTSNNTTFKKWDNFSDSLCSSVHRTAPGRAPWGPWPGPGRAPSGTHRYTWSSDGARKVTGRHSVGTLPAPLRAPCISLDQFSPGTSRAPQNMCAVEMKIGRFPYGLWIHGKPPGRENRTGPGLYVT